MNTIIHIRTKDGMNTGGSNWQEVVASYIQNKLKKKNFTVHNFNSTTLCKLRNKNIDGVVFEHPYTVFYAIIWFVALKLLGNKPYMVYSMHNDERSLFFSGARKKSVYNFCKFVIADAIAMRLAAKVIAPISLKNRVVSGVDCLFITAGEEDSLKKLNYNGQKPLRLCFIGSSFWKPNVCGVLKFVNNLQLYNAYIENVTIVGAGWAAIIPEHHKVHCTGFVEDLSEVISNIDILIAPIEDNFGINVKILEYLKYNKPILSTYEASRGITSPKIIKIDMQYWHEFLQIASNER